MTRDRLGEPQQAIAGSSVANGPAAVGKTTLTQSLPVLAAGEEARGPVGATPEIVQRKAEQQAADAPTSTMKRSGVHDIASLFGRSMAAGDASVQRKASSAAADAQPAPEIASRAGGGRR